MVCMDCRFNLADGFNLLSHRSLVQGPHGRGLHDSCLFGLEI